jgi:hypothetical protein
VNFSPRGRPSLDQVINGVELEDLQVNTPCNDTPQARTGQERQSSDDDDPELSKLEQLVQPAFRNPCFKVHTASQNCQGKNSLFYSTNQDLP